MLLRQQRLVFFRQVDLLYSRNAAATKLTIRLAFVRGGTSSTVVNVGVLTLLPEPRRQLRGKREAASAPRQLKEGDRQRSAVERFSECALSAKPKRSGKFLPADHSAIDSY